MAKSNFKIIVKAKGYDCFLELPPEFVETPNFGLVRTVDNYIIFTKPPTRYLKARLKSFLKRNKGVIGTYEIN